MGFNRITVGLLIRIILIFLMLVLLAWLVVEYKQNSLFTTTMMLGAVIGVQVWELIRWMQKTNRVLFRFFESIKHGDFVTSFDTSSPGSTNEMLLREMNLFLDSQAKRNLKQGFRIEFLEILMEHLPNGIICWGKNEQVVYQNPAAVKLVGIG
jgi:two-component system nitrogen regulation sensor histidine kinase NtrY